MFCDGVRALIKPVTFPYSCPVSFIVPSHSHIGRMCSVVEWFGRWTHDLRSRVRLPVTTLPGYSFLRQVTGLWRVNYLGNLASSDFRALYKCIIIIIIIIIITITYVNPALHPSEVAKSSTSFGCGKAGKFTAAGWQVTLCDPTWHVFSRSGVVKFTNCYTLFTFMYFTLHLTSK